MQRNLAIDVAKGIGILFVVYGHNYAVSHDNDELHRIIFSFHMPLFFFLAGLFFKESESVGTLFTSKFDALLKPYLVILILVALIGAFAKDQALQPSMLGIIWGTGLSLGAGATFGWLPMWFLPHLFLIYFYGLVTVALMEKMGIRNTATKLVVLIATAASGVYLLPIWQYLSPARVGLAGIPVTASYASPGWIFSLDLLPITGAYFLAGYVLAARVKNLTPNLYLLALAVAIFGALHAACDESINFNSRIYGNFAIASLQALCGIYIVLCVAVFIARIETLARALAFAGSGSLFILIFHTFFQDKVTNAIHKYIALDMQVSAFAGFLGGVLLPLGIYALARRNRWLAILLLPRKYKPDRQHAAATSIA